MGSETTLVVVFPVAGVLFIACEPVHDTMAVTLIVFPSTFIIVAGGISHAALAPLHSFLP